MKRWSIAIGVAAAEGAMIYILWRCHMPFWQLAVFAVLWGLANFGRARQTRADERSAGEAWLTAAEPRAVNKRHDAYFPESKGWRRTK